MDPNMDLLAAIDADKELSAVTKKNYHDRVRAICMKASGRDTTVCIKKIMLEPEKYISLMRKWYPLATSHRVHYSAILGLFRYNPEFRDEHKEKHKKWMDAFREAKEKVNARYEANEPSERQKKGYVSYDKIVEKRDSLPKGNIHRLLLGFYTYLRPMRCEYARVALYHGKVPEDAEPNYIKISSKSARLIIRHFKTRKHYDAYDLAIPKPLFDDLMASLKELPREWLFVNTKGEPFTHTLYTQWTIRAFQQLFNRHLTVALIRHAYINQLDFNNISIADKKEIATSMGHTVETQDRYRLIFHNKKGDNGSDCECVCKKTDDA